MLGAGGPGAGGPDPEGSDAVLAAPWVMPNTTYGGELGDVVAVRGSWGARLSTPRGWWIPPSTWGRRTSGRRSRLSGSSGRTGSTSVTLRRGREVGCTTTPDAKLTLRNSERAVVEMNLTPKPDKDFGRIQDSQHERKIAER